MNEFDAIIKNINRFIRFEEEEEAIFISSLRIIRVKKKQQIVQPDFICKYRSYVLTGALKAYYVGDDAQEHVIALAIDDWWISDFSSYINQEPATLFVEAIEDSILIQLSFENEQKLYESIPKFERFFRLHAQRAASAMQKRMLSNLSKTAEERYDELATRYPRFLAKFPQYVIASYLGITTQFLSKIRNNKTKS
jgi:CRP-like cAMP-binding protein